MERKSSDYTLYGHPVSGNAYKVALMLSLCSIDYDFEIVDLPAGDNLSAEFLEINPLGKIPVFRHGELLLRQSHDVLRYLASQTSLFGPNDWNEEARIGDWIGFSVDFLSYGLARLRFELLFGNGKGPIYDYFKTSADRGLSLLEPHLKNNQWLACERPTIADISVYPVMTYLTDGGYDTSDFSGITLWMERFQSLQGFGTQSKLMPDV
ncbi:MAG: hypothetical protein CL568_02430 [Alphaproteobacteria bacterium]|jgi:glutathione S-transferase|nr:hypothetical protein [Alphaproteobacteria bacterium]PPR14744.1 MAG: Disulfide-bond oxidoreductase YfcG [Alphaproteobacteria bacterium MarineAlpha12_Bin1]|tara:strand:+ start:2666 stop:3292 length:627 start_codon:yes stop_codon:yes gene_type:complete